MDDRPLSILHYLPVSPRDEQWGIVCTTAGHQHVPPGTPYPVSEHPEHYLFYKGSGRTLDEYQLVYITAGRGRFESASCPSQTVEAGTMLLLFPNEWHSYSPDPGTGWTEWWVGFRGANIDRLEQQGFLCRRRPLLRIGCSGGIERCYREIIGTVEEERVGFQPAHFEHRAPHPGVGALQAQQPALLRQPRRREDQPRESHHAHRLRPQPLARTDRPRSGHGYTWFRRVFREYVGMAPAQYQHTMRLNKARELLRDDSPQHLGNSLCARLRKRERLLALFPPPRTAQPQSVPRPLPGREGAVTAGAGQGSNPPGQAKAVTHRGQPKAAMHRGKPRLRAAGTDQGRDAPAQRLTWANRGSDPPPAKAATLRSKHEPMLCIKMKYHHIAYNL